jgi:nucleotide-binding universal stress UspA family protein
MLISVLAQQSRAMPSDGEADGALAFRLQPVLRTGVKREELIMFPIETILHPTDFSERADNAFRLACMLAHDYAARLIVVYVAQPPIKVIGGYGPVPPMPEEYEHAEAEEKLRRLESPDGSVRIERVLREGDVAGEILALAKEAPCDLIVMGTHGRTGLSRLLMGSVAEQVVRRARCPVLTVKMPFALNTPVLPAESEGVPAMR